MLGRGVFRNDGKWELVICQIKLLINNHLTTVMNPDMKWLAMGRHTKWWKMGVSYLSNKIVKLFSSMKEDHQLTTVMNPDMKWLAMGEQKRETSRPCRRES